jgi:hypothetical protein
LNERPKVLRRHVPGWLHRIGYLWACGVAGLWVH